MHERKYVCSIVDFDERFVVELIGIIKRRVKGCGVERFAESTHHSRPLPHQRVANRLHSSHPRY